MQAHAPSPGQLPCQARQAHRLQQQHVQPPRPLQQRSLPVATPPTYHPTARSPVSSRVQAAAAMSGSTLEGCSRAVHAHIPHAKPEVLAPAGGWPQLRAAVENGADAVYFGLSAFSARARAANFAPEELPQVRPAALRMGPAGTSHRLLGKAVHATAAYPCLSLPGKVHSNGQAPVLPDADGLIMCSAQTG